MSRSWGLCVFCLPMIAFTISASADDCPDPYDLLDCDLGDGDVCTDLGASISCDGSIFPDEFRAYTDGNAGYVFGTIDDTDFCCDSDNFGTAKALTINADTGDDTVYTYDPTPDPTPSWQFNTLVNGGSGDDTIYLNPYPDNTETVLGGYGDDTVVGNDGEDYIYGQNDDDTLYAGEDDDEPYANTVHGGYGNDKIYGSNNTVGTIDDYLCGCACTQSVSLCDQNSDYDRIWGRDGDDLIIGGGDHDVIRGEGGDDIIYGDYYPGYVGTEEEYDYIYGGAGEDDIWTGGGDSSGVANGDSGSDNIYVEDQFSTANGGTGSDTIDASDGQQVTINGGDGEDTITGSPYADTLNGGDEDDTIYGEGGGDTISGDLGDDTLYGGSGDDTIGGGEGADTIYGESGDDSITGSSEKDCAEGGTGVDFQSSYGGSPSSSPGDKFIDAECAILRCTGHGWEDIATSGSCP